MTVSNPARRRSPSRPTRGRRPAEVSWPRSSPARPPLPLNVDTSTCRPTWFRRTPRRSRCRQPPRCRRRWSSNSPGGGIDLFGDLQSAQNGNTVSTATVQEKAPGTVGQGYWFTYVQEIGPFGNGGAPTGSSTLMAFATTLGFDRAVTTSVGDPYLGGRRPDGAGGRAGDHPAAETGTITVTITPPAGATGTFRGAQPGHHARSGRRCSTRPVTCWRRSRTATRPRSAQAEAVPPAGPSSFGTAAPLAVIPPRRGSAGSAANGPTSAGGAPTAPAGAAGGPTGTARAPPPGTAAARSPRRGA